MLDGTPAPAASITAEDMAGFRGLIVDWGGVMTGPIFDTVRAWLDAERIDHESYTAAIRPWVAGAYALNEPENPVHALERGECSVAEFERELAARLVCRDGAAVAADGLLTRMFAATTTSSAMYAAVRATRLAGLRTALVSNSWGTSDYPRHEFPAMFDAVVISGEVGMRKPEERIFRHAVDLLALEPQECVFVDDVEFNVAAAEAIGMTAVLHRDPAETVARLGELLGLSLG